MNDVKFSTPLPLLLAVLSTAGLLVLTGSGCGSTVVTSPYEEKVDSAGLSLYTLQLNNQAFATRSVSKVELAADSIIQLSTDPEVKKKALIWKIYSAPQLRGILLFSDPYAARYDTWLFCGQVLDYFDGGQGKENFGELQEIAVRNSRTIYMEAGDLMREAVAEHIFVRLESQIDTAREEYPIDNDIYLRRSALKVMSETLGERDYSVQSAIGRMARDIEDIAGMVPIYSEQLPREARWQAEYLLAEYNWEGRVDSIQTQIVEITAAINEITRHLEQGDLEVNVGNIRNLQEYINTLEGLVDQQRAIILEEVDRLMVKTIGRVEAYADAKVDQATTEAYRIVDYVLLRILLLALGALIIAVILVLVFRQRNRRHHA
jgi:hypothetical protein